MNTKCYNKQRVLSYHGLYCHNINLDRNTENVFIDKYSHSTEGSVMP